MNMMKTPCVFTAALTVLSGTGGGIAPMKAVLPTPNSNSRPCVGTGKPACLEWCGGKMFQDKISAVEVAISALVAAGYAQDKAVALRPLLSDVYHAGYESAQESYRAAKTPGLTKAAEDSLDWFNYRLEYVLEPICGDSSCYYCEYAREIQDLAKQLKQALDE